jgi:hypothetical protein
MSLLLLTLAEIKAISLRFNHYILYYAQNKQLELTDLITDIFDTQRQYGLLLNDFDRHNSLDSTISGASSSHDFMEHKKLSHGFHHAAIGSAELANVNLKHFMAPFYDQDMMIDEHFDAGYENRHSEHMEPKSNASISSESSTSTATTTTTAVASALPSGASESKQDDASAFARIQAPFQLSAES